MEQKHLGKEVAMDAQIAAGMISAGLLSKDGMEQLQTVVQGAKDIPSAMAHAIFQVMSTVAVQLENKGMEIDDRAWVAGGGVLDKVMYDVTNVLVEAFGVKEAATKEFIERMRGEIVDLMMDDEIGREDPAAGEMGVEQMPQPMAQGSGLLGPDSSPQNAVNPQQVAPPQEQMGGLLA